MEGKQDQVIFQVFHSRSYPPEFFGGLTVFFGLLGAGTVRYRSEEYRITAGTILTVNPFELYAVTCDAQAELISMQLPERLLRRAGWDIQTSCFCYSADGAQTEEYQKLRVLFATIFQDFFQDKEKNAANIDALALQMLHILTLRFSYSDASHRGVRQEETVRRLKRIMDEIHTHWNEPLSLHALAQKEYMSESYLSRYLKQSLNMTYSQYVLRLRLSRAEEQLQRTAHSITRVAYDCGFRNASSFIDSFRQRYGLTPRQYRKQRQQTPDAGNQERGAETQQDGFAYLLQYALPRDTQQELDCRCVAVEPPAVCEPVPLRHTWKNLLNVGYAKYLLTAEVQRQIARIQREVGFRYARFHGILDEELHIYRGKTETGVECNFTFFDMVIDFLLEQGLTPFLEFSFMPRALAKTQTSIYESGSITAACADCEALGELIEQIIRHAVRRYGRTEVLRWKFTTIQQNYVFFGCMTQEEYLELYETVYCAVKRADARLSFGGPGAMSSVVWDNRGMREFLQYAQTHRCMPDFFSVQSYPHESVTVDTEFMDYTLSQQSIPSVLSKNPCFLADFLRDLRQLLREFDVEDAEICIEEWNSTLWQRDLSGDTCYKSVWLVKNICENMDAAEGFGYWTFSDMMDERADFTSVYHGGYGLTTYNGIPKSGYEALRLLAGLGEERVASGEGWYLTRGGGDYQLMVYNYSHYDNIYRYRYRRLERPEDAYSVFETGELLRYQIMLPMLSDGSYRMEEWRISRTSGSSFDLWLEIGAPSALNREQCRYLREHADAGYHTRRIQAENGVRMELLLRPLEVCLVVLHPEQ